MGTAVFSGGISMPRLFTVPAMLVLALGVAFAQDDAAKKELKKFQGTWQVVSALDSGKPVPDEVVHNLKIVIKEDRLTLKGVEDLILKFGKIKLVVDPSTMPKILDFKIEAGSEKDSTFEGIYEFKDKRLKICASTVSGNRPSEFESKAGSNRVLFVLKRENP
jgi:uncharacterized protein (TIGR03067 family)